MKTAIHSLACLLFITCTMRAEYKPNINLDDYSKDDIKQGITAIKALPVMGRECCIAEKMGLLFSPSGESGYTGEMKTMASEHTKYYEVKKDALFIGTNGKVYNFYDEMHAAWNKKSLGKDNKDVWREAKQGIGTTGEDAIFSTVAKEVTKLAQQTAKYHLKKLPIKVRDAWLAQYGGMLYMTDGTDAYNGERTYRRYGTISVKQPVVTREHKRDALFTTSKGEELNVNEVWDTLAKTAKVRGTLEHITWCASLVGVEDILLLFPKEVKAMRKYTKEAKKRISEQKESIVEDTSENATEVMSLSATRLQQIPQTTREAIISEFLDLTFMPNGEYPLDSNKWTRRGAHFIGSDGVEHDFWKEHDLISGEHWSQIIQSINTEGKEKAFAPFAKDIEAMKDAARKR